MTSAPNAWSHSPYLPAGHGLGREVAADPWLEALHTAIRRLLNSRNHNPYHGPVNLIRLYNLLRKFAPDQLWSGLDCPALLETLLEHDGPVGLLFQRHKWWVFLVEHEAWPGAAGREADGNGRVLDELAHLLDQRPPHRLPVDGFRQQYAQSGARWAFPLPARGDLVRLIRCDPRFEFDEASFEVVLRRHV
eukprot:EG_transcript_13307